MLPFLFIKDFIFLLKLKIYKYRSYQMKKYFLFYVLTIIILDDKYWNFFEKRYRKYFCAFY